MPLRLLRLWCGIRGPVSRQEYLFSGLFLLLIKYLVEALLYWRVNGGVMSAWAFLEPMAMRRVDMFGDGGAGIIFLWTLPFIWIGLTMSCRRARDAGLPAAVGLLFLLPFFNWLIMIWLSSIPTQPPQASSPTTTPSAPPPLSPSSDTAQAPRTDLPPSNEAVVVAIAVGCGIGWAMMALNVYVLRSYGGSLFVATPVAMGVASSVLAGYYRMGFRTSAGIGQVALLFSLLGMVAVASEGVVCVAMAWPLAAPLVFFGSILGWTICRRRHQYRGTMLLLALLSLPCLAWHDARPHAPRLREVVSSVEIAAPPAVVWRHVVSFPDLPAPDGIFLLGIACPLRAHIVGSGVGAVRYCEFTTGPFIEPITAWEPGRRLAFAVIAQPPAMRELSFWPNVKAPHLDGYLTSRHGEFRLIALSNGHTRLEGSTWYDVDIHPEAYWSLWSDAFIHDIHHRVLQHISQLSESDAKHGSDH